MTESMGCDSGKPAGDCIPLVHVWNHPYCGFLFPSWNAARLAGGIYDEQRALKSPASFIQHGAGRDGNGCKASFLYGMRYGGWAFGASCL